LKILLGFKEHIDGLFHLYFLKWPRRSGAS